MPRLPFLYEAWILTNGRLLDLHKDGRAVGPARLSTGVRRVGPETNDGLLLHPRETGAVVAPGVAARRGGQHRDQHAACEVSGYQST